VSQDKDYSGGAQSVQKSGSNLIVLDSRKVTWNKFLIEDIHLYFVHYPMVIMQSVQLFIL